MAGNMQYLEWEFEKLKKASENNVTAQTNPVTGGVEFSVEDTAIRDLLQNGIAERLALIPTPRIQIGAALSVAIAAGSAKVVIVGDSISAAADLIYSNGYAHALQQLLTAYLPTCKWEVVNYSIGSRNSAQLASNQYKAPGDFSFPSPLGHALDNQYWPIGSVDGQFWAWHIENEAPDLIVYAFGMNEGGNVAGLREARAGMEAYAATWAKSPDFAYVTSILPARNQDAWWDVAQAGTQEVADEVRHSALAGRKGLIDANAFFRVLRDGVMPELSPFAHEHGGRYKDDPAKWSSFDNAPVIDGNAWSFVSTSPGSVRRNVSARDIDCYANYQFTTNGVLRFGYRQRTDHNLSGYTFQFWSETGNCQLYYGTTEIAQFSAAPTANIDLQVRAVGPRHEIWLNGQKVVDVKNYQCFYAGPIRMGFEIGSGKIRHDILRLTFRDVLPAPTGQREKYLLGAVPYGDIWSNPDSAGGNAINHPSTLGSFDTYIPAAARFAKSLSDAFYDKI